MNKGWIHPPECLNLADVSVWKSYIYVPCTAESADLHFCEMALITFSVRADMLL